MIYFECDPKGFDAVHPRLISIVYWLGMSVEMRGLDVLVKNFGEIEANLEIRKKKKGTFGFTIHNKDERFIAQSINFFFKNPRSKQPCEFRLIPTGKGYARIFHIMVGPTDIFRGYEKETEGEHPTPLPISAKILSEGHIHELYLRPGGLLPSLDNSTPVNQTTIDLLRQKHAEKDHADGKAQRRSQPLGSKKAPYPKDEDPT